MTSLGLSPQSALAFGGALKLSDVHGIEAWPIDADTVFSGTRTATFYRWWTQAATDGVPRRNAFELAEHAALAPFLFLVSVLEDGNFQLRLHGDMVIYLFGHDPTGTIVRKDEGIETFGHALNEYYTTVVNSQTPHICTGDLGHVDRGFVRFESIDCPLRANDSDRISHIIGVIEQIRRPDLG